MIKVALYIRVSTEEQAINGLSLDAQKQALTEYANKKGYTIVDTYADEGITARKNIKNRKELQRLLSDIEKDKIDLVLVTKLDRWFRNIKDYYQTQDILENHNCNWKTIFENYDTSTASGRLHINIMLSVNQDECDRTSERIKAVFEHKKNNKEVCSGVVPFGYCIDENKHLKIKEDEALIVKEIFDYYEKCNNIMQTKRYISNTHNNISYPRIKRILTNKAYIGIYNEIEYFCTPIIEKAQFDRIQGFLRVNQKHYPHAKEKTYVFSGIIKCGYCGNRMCGTSTTNKNDKIYKSYRCNKHTLNGLCPKPNKISELKVEKYLLENVKKELENYKLTCIEKQKATDKNDIACKLVKCRNRLEKLKDLYLDDLIDKASYKAEYKQINDTITELEAIQENNNTINIENIDKILELDFNTIYDTLTDNEKRYLWLSVIDYIEVSTEIKIHFK